MKTICDRCNNYEVSACGTSETCWAFFNRQTKFTFEITKDYIEQRMIGEKKHCKEFKKI